MRTADYPARTTEELIEVIKTPSAAAPGLVSEAVDALGRKLVYDAYERLADARTEALPPPIAWKLEVVVDSLEIVRSKLGCSPKSPEMRRLRASILRTLDYMA